MEHSSAADACLPVTTPAMQFKLVPPNSGSKQKSLKFLDFSQKIFIDRRAVLKLFNTILV